MKLRFYARPGFVLSMPGPKVAGTAPKSIGRTLRVEEQVISNPAVKEAVEIESSTQEGRRIIRVMRCDAPDYPLWPADKGTADVCGVPYVDVEHVDGEWQPKKISRPYKAKDEVA